MVLIDDDIHDDDGDGCETCPRCQFIEHVSEYLTAAASDGADEWQADVGPLIDKMHSALWALQRLWAEEQTTYSDEIDNAGEAARALVELYERVHALRVE
jgi:hypothetical protein